MASHRVFMKKMGDRLMVVMTYTFNVEMTCEGCSKAVSNVLNKYKDQGISKFDIDLEENKVTVVTSLTKQAVLEILQKTGKKVTPLDN